MPSLRVDQGFWEVSALPEGSPERGRVANGAIVKVGQALMELQIEDTLHQVAAPSSGRLRHAASRWDAIVPGALLSYLAPAHFD